MGSEKIDTGTPAVMNASVIAVISGLFILALFHAVRTSVTLTSEPSLPPKNAFTLSPSSPTAFLPINLR